MTRKRVRESLDQFLCESCIVCDGTGTIKSRETVAYEIFRDVKRRQHAFADGNIQIEANPVVIDFIRHFEKKAIKDLEDGLSKVVKLKASQNLRIDDFKISNTK